MEPSIEAVPETKPYRESRIRIVSSWAIIICSIYILVLVFAALSGVRFLGNILSSPLLIIPSAAIMIVGGTILSITTLKKRPLALEHIFAAIHLMSTISMLVCVFIFFASDSPIHSNLAATHMTATLISLGAVVISSIALSAVILQKNKKRHSNPE